MRILVTNCGRLVMLACLLGALVGAGEALPGADWRHASGAPLALGQVPESPLRQDLQALGPAAQALALEHLSRLPLSMPDLTTVRADRGGRLYAICPAPLGGLAAGFDAQVEPAAGTRASPNIDVAVAPVYHSKPGSTKVIYLDFNGHLIQNTAWNSSYGRALFTAVAYDLDGNDASFSAAEQAAIQQIWQRVAEDYAPYEVNVTTALPASFTATTARCVITNGRDGVGNFDLPSGASAGGIAYIGVFGDPFFVSDYSPALVYFNNLSGGQADVVADAASHEVGHNLGLSHDGTTTQTYYSGHGTGETSWGPLMGISYGRNVSQWNNGSYANANNTQDDLAVLTSYLGLRPDDHGNTNGTATPLTNDASGAFSGSGIIGIGDSDRFAVSTGSGVFTATVAPLTVTGATRGNNLDARLELRNGSGTLLAASAPDASVGATVSTSLSAGTYYLIVSGVGCTNYPAYASQGQYQLSGTVAIDDPTVSISVSDAVAGEPANHGSFQISRTGPSDAALTVGLLVGGTATEGSDYQALPPSVSLPAGITSVSLSVTVLNDSLVEPNETVIVTLTAGSGYVVGSPASATVNLSSDDLPVVTVTANDSSAGEPSDHGSFLVARTGNTDQALAVTVVLSGTATPGSDYTAIGNLSTGIKVVNLPAGRDSIGVQCEILADALVEPAETVTMTLSPQSHYTIGAPSAATVTIASELPIVTVTANDPSAGEPSNNGSFVIARTGSTANALAVTVSIGGTATPGSDYQALSTGSTKTVNLPAGRVSIGLQVAILADAVLEPAETVTMTLTPQSYYVMGDPSTATVTIASELPIVTVTANDPSAGEPSNNGSFVIARTGSTANALAVTVSIGGTATPGSDYQALSTGSTRTVNIPAGRVSIGMQVTILADAVAEPTETVTMSLLPQATYEIGSPASATVTIAGELPFVTVSANDPSAGEPSNNGSFVIARTGSTASALAVTVSIGGTATPGSDYQALSTGSTKVVNLPAGRATMGLVVTVLADGVPEAAETVTMTVLPNAAYEIGSPGTATVTIAADAQGTLAATLPEGIQSVTPSDTALGNELVIYGAGLAAQRVLATLVSESATGARRPLPLRMLAVSDTEIRVRVNTGRAGAYRLVLRLPNGVRYRSPELVHLRPPELLAVTPSTASPGETLVLSGQFFGQTRGQVLLGRQRLKISQWDDTSLVVRLPRGLRPGQYPLTVRTPLGQAATPLVLTVP